jgi:hypothetical protein
LLEATRAITAAFARGPDMNKPAKNFLLNLAFWAIVMVPAIVIYNTFFHPR